jgi:hypothetical protein
MSISALAQNDSSRLDAGSLVLKRNFTQHITIKGEDLEKMPFANLADAINVWINGAYTVSGTLIYVVDGNIISDVNAYSIHDIEEVVFLQNAAALTGTAGTQQEMLLITTRRSGPGLHVRGAAQAFLVHSPWAGTNPFHQYYTGVNVNSGKFSAGISANYLRDVNPTGIPTSFTSVYEPLHLDRWRLNGSFTWRRDKKNTIEAHVGYVPQTTAAALSYLDTTSVPERFDKYSHGRILQFNSWVRWRGEWLPGLRNDLQAGYLHFTQREISGNLIHEIDSPLHINELDTSVVHAHQIFIRDRISYMVRAGEWSFEPAVNISYNYIKDSSRQSRYRQWAIGDPAADFEAYDYLNINTGTRTLWVLTPTLDISYKSILNLQGGVVVNLSGDTPEFDSIFSPGTSAFGSFTIDVLRLDGISRHNSLKLFGSYAQRSRFYNMNYYVHDIDGAGAALKYGVDPLVQPAYPWGNALPLMIPKPNIPPMEIPKYWVWEAGATWSALQDRLQIDYNLQRRNYSSMFQSPNDSIGPYLPLELKSTQHRFSISYRIFDHTDVSWRSGLNLTRLVTLAHQPVPEVLPADDWNEKPSFTGGWVNRVQCHRLSLGLDLLYHFGDISYSNIDNYFTNQENYWVIQNIYVGYKLPVSEKMGLEVYADSRGPARGGANSSTSFTLNERRYYGIGANLCF